MAENERYCDFQGESVENSFIIIYAELLELT